jgi:hypothetical protein
MVIGPGFSRPSGAANFLFYDLAPDPAMGAHGVPISQTATFAFRLPFAGLPCDLT